MKSRLLEISDSVTVGGTKYKINTDFKLWIEVEGLLFDDKTDPLVRLAKVLTLVYPQLPPNPYEAVDGVIKFYTGGTSQNVSEGQSAPRSFDIREDFDYIWGGFITQYGIDLMTTDMHWWKFKTLLACLNENCKFSRIVAFRTMDTSFIKDKELRRYYEKMKKKFRLGKSGSYSAGESTVVSSLEGMF